MFIQMQLSFGQALTYDENGNLTSDGARDFLWDGEDRISRVINHQTTPATVTDFTYDGFSRRVRIKSTAGLGGPTLSDARYLWAGSQIAEERDTAGVVTKRFFGNGVQSAGGNLFYQRDHLGSIRGVADSSGAIRGAYDFDLWGRRTKLTGDISADFGFTGHLENGATGLTLAWFRGYDSGMGRWISRDPIAERGGLNLYGYVGNMPNFYWDVFGLKTVYLEPIYSLEDPNQIIGWREVGSGREVPPNELQTGHDGAYHNRTDDVFVGSCGETYAPNTDYSPPKDEPWYQPFLDFIFGDESEGLDDGSGGGTKG